MSQFQKEMLLRLINESGGETSHDKWVIKPGCMIVSRSEITPEAKALFDLMNIDDASEYERMAEFNSRLTYLSFKKEKTSSHAYNTKMAQELQHLSVYGNLSVTFLLAGISVETSMELISHSEATVARLTTSNTTAMTDPLYRVSADNEKDANTQKICLGKLSLLKDSWKNDIFFKSLSIEMVNSMNPGNKATAINYTMSLKNFHKLFIGRCPVPGNESEVREIVKMMCDKLHQDYPLVIQSFDAYAGKNNGEKYHV